MPSAGSCMEFDHAHAAPLLPSRSVDGCPGCLLQQRVAARNGSPPAKELSFVALISLCSALPISSLFPFIYFMVEDFNIAKSDTMVATYAGYIGSAMMLGRFISSAFWGIVADQYGRKPVILIGTFSIIIFNALFGFCTNFWMALMARFLLGLCNGILGAMKAYSSEICSKENQASGVSMLTTTWAVGLILGPAIGGYLTQPSDKYPAIFPTGSLFDRFPYALPCLCISAFAVPALISGFFIAESLHNHKLKPKINVMDPSAYLEIEKLEDDTSVMSNLKIEKDPPLWKNISALTAMYIYCVWGLHSMAYSEMFSWWAVSSEHLGGLGFSTSQVADVLAIAGTIFFLFQLFLTPRLTKFFGALRMVQVPAALTIILTSLYPLFSKLDGVQLWCVLVLSQSLKLILSTSRQRGLANGVSTSIMSLCKAFGPSIAGFIFSMGQVRIDASFLPGMWMVFGSVSILALVAAVPSFGHLSMKSLEK
ncbi:hypothetical protein KP509_03G043700 [Ceratopteris richardii]|uniref:Major facilitator superfamily (MFS) profile domain-containing protein n=1 Tax=Ceratopteris richardii TaxID=49495 RepID=A0A8T2VB06_CERRI|nr:hypothetical protein KP509_03G043700 [Ceratopteris richardii]